MATQNNGQTGVSQSTLDSLLKNGQDPSFDSKIFNSLPYLGSSAIEGITNPYLNNSNTPVAGVRLDANNAPNTSEQNRQLSNATFDLNAQAFNNQRTAIVNNQNQQVRQLTQQAKDAQATMLQTFGQASFLMGDESSRNLSALTDNTTKLRLAVGDIANRSLELLNQNALNFAQANVQALGQSRQLDFQDRQQQFSEDITRGQEQGFVFDKGVKTSTPTMARESFDFQKEVTGAELTGDFRGQRTLQGMMTDANLVSQRINQAITLGQYDGFERDLTGVTDMDGVFDPTNRTGARSQSGQVFDLQLPGMQYDAEKNRYALESGLAQDEIDAMRQELAASYQQNKWTEENYKNIFGGNSQVGQLASLYDFTMQEFLKNPNEANAAKLAELKAQIDSQVGNNNGMYYKFGGLSIDPKTGAMSANVESTPDKIIEFGFDGNADFKSSIPAVNEKLASARTDLTKYVVEQILPKGDSPEFINKIFFSADRDGNKLLTAYKLADKDGKPVGGYGFYELDLSKMNIKDKAKLQEAVRDGKYTKDDGTVVGTGNKDLNNLNNVLNEFSQSKGLIKNRLDTSAFMGKMDQYGVSNKQVLDGVSNKQLMSLLMLSSKPGGVALFTKDSQLTDFASFSTNMRDTVDNINEQANRANNPGMVNTDQAFRDLVNGEKEIKLKDRAGNVMRDNAGREIKLNYSLNDNDLKLLRNLRTWYNQYDSGNQTYAQDYLKGILSSLGAGIGASDFERSSGEWATLLDPIAVSLQ